MKTRTKKMSDPIYNPGCLTSDRKLRGNIRDYIVNYPDTDSSKRSGFSPEQESVIQAMIRRAVDEAIGSQPSNRKGEEEE